MSAPSYKTALPIAIMGASVICFAGWMGFSPASYAAPAVLQTATPTPAPTASPFAGRLRFADNDKTPTGSFDLQIDSVAAPPVGDHYELWLRTGDGEPLDLGALPAGTGSINFKGSTEQPLLANYDTAMVSVEPDEDSDPSISEQIVLSGTLSPAVLAPLRRLYFGNESQDKGFLAGAVEQVGIATAHSTISGAGTC